MPKLAYLVVAALAYSRASEAQSDTLKIPPIGLSATPSMEALRPFGFRFGTPRKELERFVSVPEVGGVYATTRAPEPHPDFKTYLLVADDSVGLCKVGAHSVPITINPFGEQVKRRFREFKEDLVERYGKGEHIDMLTPGSIWDEPRDWAMAMVKEERSVLSLWSKANGDRLPPNIANLGIKITALSVDRAMIVAEYESIDASGCLARLKKARARLP